MGASMRYLSQRFTAPNRICAGVLNDVGTEELAHLEMVSTIVHQLTKNLSMEEIEKSGFANYYVDHTVGVWPQAAGGVPFNACEFQSKGDPITDLHEDLAAEMKARTTYDNILRLVKDPEVADPIKFLREREVVHYQRFGEALRSLQEQLDANNFFAFNPSFDNPASCNAPAGTVVPAPPCEPKPEKCDGPRGSRPIHPLPGDMPPAKPGYGCPPQRNPYNCGRGQRPYNNRNNNL